MKNIKIGDNNNIVSSNFGDNIKKDEKRGFYIKHPVISAVMISIIVGVLLMFNFWDKIILFIESIFK